MSESYYYSQLFEQQPDGIMWKETDYFKQKKLERYNPIFKKRKI